MALRETEIHTVVVGTGAAGYQAALRLYQFGERDFVVLSENTLAGTSRNTGSDKQTYYKLSLAGKNPDSVRGMAEDLFAGQCVDGDLALCEAALSSRCFYRLIELGVPFPDNEYGEAIGYRTDHDRNGRASSVGPYTSKVMVECLEREARSLGIRVMDRMQMIRILVKNGRVRGILCLDTGSAEECIFTLIWCENLVLAAGGPAGMYRDSVYPASQLGSSGIAFEAGIRGKNLTEWQFGMASLKPRWNVSGTYMQVLPRMVSTDRQREDEREFLADYFEDPAQMLLLTFLKGYQWPFDSGRIFGGSSVIDLLVYQETVLKGRRVFLDFRSNPGGGVIDWDRLPAEAFAYLSGAGACFGTPIERLIHMNEPAAAFYREHGVDLRREMLEIAVCAQHNNGGLAADLHWQTNIEGIYAVGEICGSHGVARPGGSALNAGQVGALRAAEHIAGRKERREMPGQGQNEPSCANEEKFDCGNGEKIAGERRSVSSVGGGESDREKDREYCRKLAEERMALFRISGGRSNLEEIWEKASRRMSRAGGMIRCGEEIEQALSEAEEERGHFAETVRVSDVRQAGRFYHLYDMLTAQQVYLAAMLDYIRRGGGSRGSALYTCPDGEKPGEKMPDLYRCRPDGGKLGGMIQEMELCGQGCQARWRPVRPLPDPDYFFETQWKAFRERHKPQVKIL